MDFDAYQKSALKTDIVPGSVKGGPAEAIIVPMLGLAGEAGQLLSEYKKHLRDGDAHKLFKDRVTEELGDLLWYISNVASKFDLSLNEVAQINLEKTDGRWSGNQHSNWNFDDDMPVGERLPRQATIEIHSLDEARVRIFVDGEQAGADLTDNAYDPDGYRFHDVFHFAYAAILGWSPVTRYILSLKRRSDDKKDEIEDGGRAIVIEEGISALVFEYARNHNFLEGVSRLDFHLLRTIKDMSTHLEVRARTPAEWENAIIQGYRVWREILKHQGGRFDIDQSTREIKFLGPTRV